MEARARNSILEFETLVSDFQELWNGISLTSKRCPIGRQGGCSGFCEHAPIGRVVFLWSFENFQSCCWAWYVHLRRPTTTPWIKKSCPYSSYWKCQHHDADTSRYQEIPLCGADFEIIPTNSILPAHHLWARSLHFPPRAGCFFHGRQVHQEKSEATRPIPWYQPRTGYAPLRSRCQSLWAWQWHIIAIISLHCLSEIGTLSQNQYWFLRRKLAQLLYLVVTLFCTQSSGT